MAIITLAFTVPNAKAIIALGAIADGPHSHAEIADWCEQFWNAYADVDVPADIERIMPVLADVESQWDMYLASVLAKQPDLSLRQVAAPREWFKTWSEQIDV